MCEIPVNIKERIEEIRQKSENIKPIVAIHSLAYNHESYIHDALEGFVMQKTNFPFVAIVHDDASTDKTADIIREYADKYPEIIKPIFEKENQYSKPGSPLEKIMQEAIEATGAKYVAMCEGDDYWTDPLKLQKQVDFLESHPDFGMCYTKVQRYYQNENRIIDTWGGISESFEDLLKANTIPTLTVVLRVNLRKRYLREIRPESKNWRMGDYPLWLFLAYNSKVKFINNPTGVYRILSESASHSKSYKNNLLFALSSGHITYHFSNLYNFDSSTKQIIICGIEMQLAVLDNDKAKISTLRSILKKQLNSTICIKERIKANMLLRFPTFMTYLLKHKYVLLNN